MDRPAAWFIDPLGSAFWLSMGPRLTAAPVMAVLVGKLQVRRADCAPLAGKSALNRLWKSGKLSRPLGDALPRGQPLSRSRSLICSWSRSLPTHIDASGSLERGVVA